MLQWSQNYDTETTVRCNAPSRVDNAMRRRRTVYDRRDIHLLASVEREKKSKETTNQKKNRMGEKKGPFFFRQPRFPDDRCPPPPRPPPPYPIKRLLYNGCVGRFLLNFASSSYQKRKRRAKAWMISPRTASTLVSPPVKHRQKHLMGYLCIFFAE